MIGYLEGTVINRDEGKVTVLTGLGIGYQVHIGKHFEAEQQVSLFISHIFRETGQDLFGFVSLRDKQIFEMLLQVKGVGPKTAFNLVENLGVETLIHALMTEDKKILRKAPGIGEKTAEQIILDLKNKITKKIPLVDFLKNESSSKKEKSAKVVSEKGVFDNSDNLVTDVLQACRELGLDEKWSYKMAVTKSQEHAVKSSQDLLKLILNELR